MIQMSTVSALVCAPFLIHTFSFWRHSYFHAALNPNYKVTYAKAKWASQDFADGVKQCRNNNTARREQSSWLYL
jgi:hypothetical protein